MPNRYDHHYLAASMPVNNVFRPRAASCSACGSYGFQQLTTNVNPSVSGNEEYDSVGSLSPSRKNARFSLPPGTGGPTNDVEKNEEKDHLLDGDSSTTPLTTRQNDVNQQPASKKQTHHHPSLAERIKDKIHNVVPHGHSGGGGGGGGGGTPPVKPKEYKLRAFVGFLFLIVVFLVAFTYIFYYHQQAQFKYFDRIRFTDDDRVMRVYNDAGQEALHGQMGAAFSTSEKAYKCHEKHWPANATVCLEWMKRGRFSLTQTANQHNDDKSRCYRVVWQSLNADVFPTDCYDMEGHFWFGAGAVLGHVYDFAGWPLNRAEVPMTGFVTGSEVRGNNAWGPVLRRYFMSSKAAAIIVDDGTPLWVSVNANQSQQLCLQSRAGQFPFFHNGEDSPYNLYYYSSKNVTDSNPIYHILNYTICTAADLETLLTSLSDQTMWDGLRKDEMEVLRKLMEDPVWRFHPLPEDNQTAQLMNYTNSIVKSVWTSPGYLLIDAPWEEHQGDLDFDTRRFQDLKPALDIIHRKGFKVAVTVGPFVSTFSKTYRAGLALPGMPESSAGAWIVQPFGEGAPALVSYNKDHSLALADVTSEKVSRWVGARLTTLMSRYDLDGIFFESVTVDHLPHFYLTAKPLADPSKLSSLWVDAARQVTNVISVSSAVQMPRLPTFVAIPWLPASWEGLAHLLPLVLTLSVSGYPFLIPPPVGGFAANSTSPPERELFIRWLQVSMFLPVVQFSVLPSAYDAEVESLASNLTTLRTSTILPLLQRYGGDSVINGLPIIRPLWMLDPFDKEGLDVSTEFMVGDELLVAPVLEEGMREREVYLPKGVWKDGIDGSLRKGGRWIHHHKAKLDQIAYFIRMPEGTRL